ncbi:MAG: ribosome biogenesis GTPase Der [Bacteroidetes bacterium]|nr:MAG: ribosome biogenesis GTPase Der [Bacteroidota bacterium]
MANIVAIVGRPNVGKSTLFNRLIEQRKAIMDDVSGVTRDRHYGVGQWNGRSFTVIDTGGYVHGSEDVFEASIREQVKLAMEEATIILFMVDARAGMTPLDKDFATILHKSSKPVYVVVNKVDSSQQVNDSAEFYELGFEDVFPLSSQSGAGTGEVLDKVIENLEEDEDKTVEKLPRLAILGRPNVGKSSFLNALLGKERTIVTDIAGTTRDSIDTPYNAFGYNFILTDTAGIRRKSKISEDIEFYSILRSIKSLEDSDVCIILLDATRGLEMQDINIINLAIRRGKGVVLMVNKWDLIEKDHKTAKIFEDEVKARLAPTDYIPMIFTSVINKQRIFQTIEKAAQVYSNKKKQIPTSELNDKILPEIEKYPPPALKGKYIKIKYLTQTKSQIPTFLLFCNSPQYIKEPYVRYLENKFREHFDFEGVPVNIFFRKK